jgi:hypothetical protein
MACMRKRRVGKGYRWVLDYRDQQGRRHWETTKGNRKEAERLLSERVRQISRGTYQAPIEQVSFETMAQAYLKHTEGNVRFTSFKDYRCNLNRHLTNAPLPGMENPGHSAGRRRGLVEANIFAPPEIQALLAATDPRWRVVILTAMLTVAQVETIEDSLVEVGSRA